MKRNNFHIYTLVSSIKNLPYIFLLPVLIIFIFNKSSILMLIVLYPLCILFMAFAVYLSFYSYIKKSILIDCPKVKIKSGIFTRKEKVFSMEKICCISTQQTLFTRLIGAYKTFICFYRTDYTLRKGIYLNKKQIANLSRYFRRRKKEGSGGTLYKIDGYKLMILSLCHCNIVSAVIVGIPFLKKTRDVFMIIDANFQSNLVLNKTRPFIINIFFLNFGLICTVFLIQMAKFWGLKVYKTENAVHIQHGGLFRMSHIISLSQICAVSYKESLINIISKTRLVHLHTITNYSKQDGIITALISSLGGSTFDNPVSKKPQNQIFKIIPQKRSVINHLYFPAIVYISVVVASLFLRNYRFAIISIVSILMIWVVFIRLYAFKRYGITLYENLIYVGLYSKLSLITALIPIVKITKIKIKQSIFQKYSKKCHIYIYIAANSTKVFKIKHLDEKMLKVLLKSLKTYI